MQRNLVGWLHRQAPGRRVYERPPLALALCQVRFAPKFGLNDAVVAPFQEAIESEFPDSSREEQVATFQWGGASVQLGMQAQSPDTRWKFVDESGDWTVTLAQEFVSLETRTYDEFDRFLERLRWVLHTLIQTVKPSLGRRIGLRYINELRSAEREWTAMIRPELLGVLVIESFRHNCDRAMQTLALQAGDARINLQHGPIPSGSTVVPKPGADRDDRPFYLLDIDMFQEFAPPRSLKMDAMMICRLVESYHSTVSEFFRWATTAEYRDGLGERGHVVS